MNGVKEEKKLQFITIHVDDLKNALLSQAPRFISLIEKIVENADNVPKEVLIEATIIGTELGLDIITDKMIGEMLASIGPGCDGTPKHCHIFIEESPTNFEEVVGIIHAGDVPEEELDPPQMVGVPEGMDEEV